MRVVSPLAPFSTGSDRLKSTLRRHAGNQPATALHEGRFIALYSNKIKILENICIHPHIYFTGANDLEIFGQYYLTFK